MEPGRNLDTQMALQALDQAGFGGSELAAGSLAS
jgi:hypothetical protein